MTLTISAIASILVIGALIASPDAYSTKNNDVLDECKCEKPDTLIFDFFVPDGTEMGTEFRIEIFKKLADRDDPGKLLLSIMNLEGGETNLSIEAKMFGKDKLESNTSFVVYEVDGGIDTETELPVDVIVALIEIHTSCSQPLYKGLTKENNGYSITVVDGLLGEDGDSSIPIANASICEDEKKKSTGSITVKKALTNDNGGTASEENFTITVTNVETADPFDLVSTGDLTISTRDVPAGTYTISETKLDGYTTVLIAGDTGCPSMVNEEFTIKKGKNLSCIIYNDDDFVAGGNEGTAPTVKITVQVNNLEGVTPDQFEYTIGTNMMIKNGDEPVTIPINTPTMFSQTNFIDRSDPDNLVLPASIEGDGNCPDVIGTNGDEIGFLTLSANQNIECVIVYGKVIEPGVVFHFDSLRFNSGSFFDPEFSGDDLDKCDSMESIKPCILENPEKGEFNVVPNITESQLLVTALIQLNVIALATDNTMVDFDGEASCEFISTGRSPKGNPAFRFVCQELESEVDQFRVNYALIETLQAGKTLT